MLRFGNRTLITHYLLLKAGNFIKKTTFVLNLFGWPKFSKMQWNKHNGLYITHSITYCNTWMDSTLSYWIIYLFNKQNAIVALILLLEVIRWDYTLFYILKCSWIIPAVSTSTFNILFSKIFRLLCIFFLQIFLEGLFLAHKYMPM